MQEFCQIKFINVREKKSNYVKVTALPALLPPLLCASMILISLVRHSLHWNGFTYSKRAASKTTIPKLMLDWTNDNVVISSGVSACQNLKG